MTLPLPYRPPAVLEFMEEERRQEERNALKIKISKPYAFKSALGAWYQRLGKKQKQTLTRKKLMHQAVNQAHLLRIPFDKLPKNWIKDLKKDYNLELFITKEELLKVVQSSNLKYKSIRLNKTQIRFQPDMYLTNN